jgi:peptide/nickel transport system ATP-binding protein
MSAPLLSVRDLSIAFHQGGRETLAVDHVSFDLQSGRTLALVGESGSGKSITALSIVKLLGSTSATYPSGQVLFKGDDLLLASDDKLRSVRGNEITMVFQEPMTSLNPLHSIEKQIGEILALHGMRGEDELRARVIELLEEVGIPDPASRLNAYPHQLSGGLRQRVMIAMSLMCDPELLIADEPSTALDVTIQAQILRLLADLQKELGIAMVLITHDLGVVARIADRVAVMYAGQVVEQGSAAEIFSAPQHPYTRGLISCIPIPGRTIPGGKLGTIPGVVPSLLGEMTGCAFRERCASAQVSCAGSIPVHQTPHGHQWRCVLEPTKVVAA